MTRMKRMRKTAATRTMIAGRPLLENQTKNSRAELAAPLAPAGAHIRAASSQPASARAAVRQSRRRVPEDVLRAETHQRPPQAQQQAGGFNGSAQHLLILRGEEVCDGDVTNLVHGSAEGRAVGSMEERAKCCGHLTGAGKEEQDRR